VKEKSPLLDVLFRARRALVALMHLALWAACFIFAFLLRFEFRFPTGQGYDYPGMIRHCLPMLLVLRAASGLFFGVLHGLWRYTGARDLKNLFKATTFSTILFAAAVTFTQVKSFPRAVYVIDWLLALVVVGGLRFSIRTAREMFARARGLGTGRRVLIVGAGDAGEALARELLRTEIGGLSPVGFVDDETAKQAETIHGVPVIGTTQQIEELVKAHSIDEVLIAFDLADKEKLRKVVRSCSNVGVRARTMPQLETLIKGRVRIAELREVEMEDLLRREPIRLDQAAINDFLHKGSILVTGSGGSIGSELCRQVCRFSPSKLILVERSENNLFVIHRELVEKYPELTIVPCIADVGDALRMDRIFSEHRPAVVFHAAAHKHVPMMESNVAEAVKNNILGTKCVADLSNAHGVSAFVMISTDKAVNPTSVMGASKRAAEIYVQSLSQRSETRFVTVRFGNVLGSAGSVIPIFQEQIRKGGPVTVTHPEMRRYFMTIPEACQLVLQAAQMSTAGGIYVLDMGTPVKIVDLARDLIALNGLRVGEDIAIEFTGMRPGEKLFEELSTDGENFEKTAHPKVFLGLGNPEPWDAVGKRIEAFAALVAQDDCDALARKELRAMIPEFAPSIPSRPSQPNQERQVVESVPAMAILAAGRAATK
jgi:FlaA1/EpsC-like NDP-sugar epimerase